VSGISPKLPLYTDPVDGIALNKTLKQMTRQNLKMIILTSPGERIMHPKFGVGLRRYLFMNNTQSTLSDISRKIEQQVRTYLPTVRIRSIKFLSENGEEVRSSFESSSSSNYVKLVIDYEIPSAFVSDTLDIKV
jgi:phage baseplate assembly protein W|tara:strand:+ start:168 stop:569 length:402 start_codon:yes stop_codon:yes gene_type:complete